MRIALVAHARKGKPNDARRCGADRMRLLGQVMAQGQMLTGIAVGVGLGTALGLTGS